MNNDSTRTYAIAGIHTGIGKTISSAVLAEALNADYWKPVQAGNIEDSDSIFVRQHIRNTKTFIHPEQFLLKLAASPHQAAEAEGIEILLTDFKLPQTSNSLIVETAGGIFSPLNRKHTMLDLIKHLNIPVILISQNYLGSINHTLLSIHAMMNSGVKIEGLIFNGLYNSASEEYILEHSGINLLGRIDYSEILSKEFICKEAENLRSKLNEIRNQITY
ncbi:MAG: dethiobiotin synthase [Bacteroidetes bacterium]|nr:MAG: dethiobiotin synthase [Bacteroidota bacterium]REJ99845.1 MAG: dethiobiotin synthase [Bacteroidota bacterium]REK34218.1 MAG: dethiobiotin synthase [Bacteroidota bacterium]REK50548.1 MAG: dethiobiotin synthase [Bacteroidota bacterium]